MKRKEFIEKLGVGAAFVLTSTCLLSCSKDDDNNNSTDPTNPTTGGGTSTGVDFTINVSEYSELANNGGYIIQKEIVIAKDVNGDFVAATQTCSHQGYKQIVFNDNKWECLQHGAQFDLSGGGLNANGSKGLTIYKTELSGDSLRIYS